MNSLKSSPKVAGRAQVAAERVPEAADRASGGKKEIKKKSSFVMVS